MDESMVIQMKKELLDFVDKNGSYERFYWPYVFNRELILENQILICLK